MKHEFKCSQCQCDVVHEAEITTGYALDKDENKICFACCAVNDKQSMLTNRNSKRLPLYLSGDKPPFRVTNWPGTLSFRCFTYSEGKHSCYGGYTKRTDVWFHGPDGRVWWGRHIGRNTDIVHCKSTKVRS